MTFRTKPLENLTGSFKRNDFELRLMDKLLKKVKILITWIFFYVS